MNIMLETANVDECPYLAGATYADGSEETIWYCPECGKEGGENKLLYDGPSKALVCSCCMASYRDDNALAVAYRDAMTELSGELIAERQDNASRARKLEAIRRVAA